jgi:hypothetical protein
MTTERVAGLVSLIPGEKEDAEVAGRRIQIRLTPRKSK